MTNRMPYFRPLALIALFLTALCASAQRIPITAAELPRYDLKVDYRSEPVLFEVSGTITLPPSPTHRAFVELSLTEAMGEVKFSGLAASGNDQGVTATSHLRPSTSRAGWGTNTWRIEKSDGFPAGQPVAVKFGYRSKQEFGINLVYAGASMAFGTGTLSAWYPQLEREPVGEDGGLRGLRGTGRISFSAPAGMTVFANGEKLQGPAGRFDYKFDKPIFFAFSAGTYHTAHRPGLVPTTAYVLHERSSTQELLARSQRIVELLAQEFSPYPYPSFAVVEIPSDIAQKAGFDGACLEGFIYATTKYLDRRFSTAFFAHEIGHQWWPYMLGPGGDRGNYMLTDAMVQFGSLRAVELMEGAEAAERYRRTGYPAFYSEFSGTGYLQIAAAGADMPLSQTYPPSHPDGRLSFSLAGSKGMLVWDRLSREMGRERFSAVLRKLIVENLYQRLPLEEFRKRFSQAAGSDWSWFFEEWLDRTGAPELNLTWRQEGDHVRGHVDQQGVAYRATVVVEVETKDGRKVGQALKILGASTPFALTAAGSVVDVRIDPEYQLLRWTDDYRREAQALAWYTRGNLAFNSSGGDKAASIFRDGLEQMRGRADEHAVRFLLHYGLSDALLSSDHFEEAWRETDAALSSQPQRAEVLPLVYVLRARIADNTKNSAAFDEAAAQARKADEAVGGNTGASEQILDLTRRRDSKR